MNRYQFDDTKHLHTLDGKALTGTSSVVDVLSKPLTWWAAGLACEKLGWYNTRKKQNESEEDYKVRMVKGETRLQEVYEIVKGMDLLSYSKLLNSAYKAHNEYKNEAADKGTDLHAELEHWVKAQMGKVPERADYDPKITPFVEWAKKNVKKYLWSEAHCYSEKLWTGGISDLGVELNDGKIAVIDFKSSKEAYISQFVQAGGYALEIEENGLFDENGKVNKKIDGKVEALIIVPFGATPVLPVIMRDIDAYKRGFEAAVTLYRLMFNHNE